MHFGRSLNLIAIVGAGLCLEFPHAHPTLRSIAAYTSLNATEFRWNLLFFWLTLGLTVGGGLQNSWRSCNLTRIGLCALFYLSVSYGEHIVGEAINFESGLWAAPVHLLVAGLLPVGLLVFTLSGAAVYRFRVSANLSVLAVGLAYLGLLWNFYQTFLLEGWAWDWIETGPCWLLLSSLWAGHTWSKTKAIGLLSYVGFLGLSRTALLTSAHHLQSPQGNLAIDRLSTHGDLAFDVVSVCYETAVSLSTVGIKSLPFFVTAAVFVYAASRFLVLWKNELRGQSMAQAGLQDYAPAYTFGLSAGLFFGLSGAYSLPVALLTIILSRVTSYTRQLHGGVILFFLAGVALVWYAADWASGRLGANTSVFLFIADSGVPSLMRYTEYGAYALALLSWYLPGRHSTSGKTRRFAVAF